MPHRASRAWRSGQGNTQRPRGEARAQPAAKWRASRAPVAQARQPPAARRSRGRPNRLVRLFEIQQASIEAARRRGRRLCRQSYFRMWRWKKGSRSRAVPRASARALVGERLAGRAEVAAGDVSASGKASAPQWRRKPALKRGCMWWMWIRRSEQGRPR